MNRFKCPVCGGNQYTACDTSEKCIYCGYKGQLMKMKTLEPEESRTPDTVAVRVANLISEGEIYYSGIYDCRLNARVTEVILDALREQAEREKGCVWCKENGMVTHNGQHYELFCSYCGRRLEVKGDELL